ncbi:hypothetical protein GCM10009836_51910 [Pseudonocardia ailaonensis]|uniref:YdhG-like domain-containing protein n=1 Tax=Pseudonocardia ailaonensis TaxID=367279 RepID=A0ABN2NHZ1_9PSEU
MDAAVQEYIDAIEPGSRVLFDRVDGLVRAAFPQVEVVFSYKMPTYRVGPKGLHVAAWKHGISLYGWNGEADGGLAARFPKATSGRGTLKITPDMGTQISDAELTALIRGALAS